MSRPPAVCLLLANFVCLIALSLGWIPHGVHGHTRINLLNSLRSKSPQESQSKLSSSPTSSDSSSSSSSAGSLKGFKGFVRTNPKSDTIPAQSFHHVEFWCGDATTTSKRFSLGLGMNFICKSDQSTGNTKHASYVVNSGDMTMMFTAPYSSNASDASDTSAPFPHYNGQEAFDFICKHGQAVRAIGINVGDVEKSFNTLVERGAKPVTAPSRITDKSSLGYADYAEINIYGDVVLRLINTDNYEGRFFPNFADCEAVQKPTLLTSYQRDEGEGRESGAASELVDYGFVRFDHVVGNLWQLEPTLSQLKSITGFHDFAEFVAEDVGTVDSGLNSVVLANNNELILLPLNEPTYGTRRKSQIQTYLEQNQGEGVQHIAMFTKDIFKTMRHMRAASAWGGFEFQAPPNKQYYENLRNRLGDSLTDEQYRLIEELHILADKDDQGVLLQIFTKPVGDRATLFLEVIQRVGCPTDEEPYRQKAGCGGFGKGNFKDLFQTIENYEKTLNI